MINWDFPKYDSVLLGHDLILFIKEFMSELYVILILFYANGILKYMKGKVPS